MVESLRKLVSGNRRRFHDENYSLDLTYITPMRLIAMSYPAVGIFERVYRNSIDDVSPQSQRSNHFKQTLPCIKISNQSSHNSLPSPYRSQSS